MSKKKFTPKTSTSPGRTSEPLIFGKKHYLLMGIGLGLIVLGMLLMLGGKMPDPNTWDDSLIYSHRRITLAPLCIVAGLILQVYAIFFKVKPIHD
jgi:drug/metabolite transporter (DMT)-like permease